MSIKPFHDTVKNLRRGGFLDECAEALHEAVNATEEHGKPSKVLIELVVKPASKQSGTVIISDKVTVKKPTFPPGETIMFVTPEGNLQTDNPKQEKLDLKAVPVQPETELRQIHG